MERLSNEEIRERYGNISWEEYVCFKEIEARNRRIKKSQAICSDLRASVSGDDRLARGKERIGADKVFND